jgi:hypothetical protein
MKHKFVMDENTVVSALTLEDDQGNPDLTCAQLWINIASNCHSIVLNDYLRQGYYEIAGRVREKGMGFMKILNHITKTLGKLEYMSYLPNPQWAAKLPTDDAPIVLLAVQSRAVLVTSDFRLRTALQSLSAAETKSLTVLTPEDAVPLSLDR